MSKGVFHSIKTYMTAAAMALSIAPAASGQLRIEYHDPANAKVQLHKEQKFSTRIELEQEITKYLADYCSVNQFETSGAVTKNNRWFNSSIGKPFTVYEGNTIIESGINQDVKKIVAISKGQASIVKYHCHPNKAARDLGVLPSPADIRSATYIMSEVYKAGHNPDFLFRVVTIGEDNKIITSEYKPKLETKKKLQFFAERYRERFTRKADPKQFLDFLLGGSAYGTRTSESELLTELNKLNQDLEEQIYIKSVKEEYDRIILESVYSSEMLRTIIDIIDMKKGQEKEVLRVITNYASQHTGFDVRILPQK
jgi:hypothetical protein